MLEGEGAELRQRLHALVEHVSMACKLFTFTFTWPMDHKARAAAAARAAGHVQLRHSGQACEGLEQLGHDCVRLVCNGQDLEAVQAAETLWQQECGRAGSAAAVQV